MSTAAFTASVSNALQVLGTPERQLRITTALPLQARRSGWLVVDEGPVWITASGDTTDHVLAPGQALHLGPGQRLVAEPWRTGRAARLRWVMAAPAGQPDLPVLRAAAEPAPGLLALGWRLVAWGLRGAAWRLAAAARSAESRASSAQGRICAGDSIAASGALQ